MDSETTRYIIRHFPNLMTGDEQIALRHTNYTYKIEHSSSGKEHLKKMYTNRGCLTSDQKVLGLLKDGYDSFELNVANRILAQCPDKVFMNNCPKCNKLARTPYARQCRHCGHSWHEIIVAKFQLNSSLQLTGREFFLIGTITSGHIKKGDFIDLTMSGLNKKPQIKAIEFVLRRQDQNAVEYVALGTNDLIEEEKLFLIKKRYFWTPLDILDRV